MTERNDSKVLCAQARKPGDRLALRMACNQRPDFSVVSYSLRRLAQGGRCPSYPYLKSDRNNRAIKNKHTLSFQSTGRLNKSFSPQQHTLYKLLLQKFEVVVIFQGFHALLGHLATTNANGCVFSIKTKNPRRNLRLTENLQRFRVLPTRCIFMFLSQTLHMRKSDQQDAVAWGKVGCIFPWKTSTMHETIRSTGVMAGRQSDDRAVHKTISTLYVSS